MPEGPEVHTFADWLYGSIAQTTLVGIEIGSKSRYARRPIPNLDVWRSRLPMTVTDVVAHGKKIVFMFNDSTDAPVYMISSLGMEGKWTFTPEAHSDVWLRLAGEDDDVLLYFDDSRHFGTIEVCLSQSDLLDKVKHIGPDLISVDVSEDAWMAKLGNRRLSQKKIGVFLLEQKHVSGIGNYLRAEILYAARISPHRPISSLSREEGCRILHHATRIIRESYAAQGASLMTYRSPHGDKGTYRVIVYGHDRCPDGHSITREDLGDKRTMHWVPAVQI